MDGAQKQSFIKEREDAPRRVVTTISFSRPGHRGVSVIEAKSLGCKTRCKGQTGRLERSLSS